jgi:hypothetical protein
MVGPSLDRFIPKKIFYSWQNSLVFTIRNPDTTSGFRMARIPDHLTTGQKWNSKTDHGQVFGCWLYPEKFSEFLWNFNIVKLANQYLQCVCIKPFWRIFSGIYSQPSISGRSISRRVPIYGDICVRISNKSRFRIRIRFQVVQIIIQVSNFTLG